MTSIEDRLTAAAHAAADTVPPGSAPPLSLPEQSRRARSRARRRGWPGWAVPLASAFAVTLAVSTSIAVTSLAGGTRRPALRAAPSGAGTTAPTSAHPGTVDGLPPLFMTLGRATHTVAIASTSTGTVVTTVRLPGQAYRIAAGGDGRTFYAAVAFPRCQPGPGPTAAPGTGSASVGAGTAGNPAGGGKAGCQGSASQQRTYFYKITVTGTRATEHVLPMQPVTVSAAHIGSPQSGYFPAVAALSPSPDGGRLAYTTYTVTAHEGLIRRLYVASTTTGATREWATSSPGSMNGYLSWLADGRAVAFDWLNSGSRGPGPGLYVLNVGSSTLGTNIPGHRLLPGTPVLPMTAAGDTFKILMASPDGSTVIGYTPRISPKVTGQGANAAGGPVGSVVGFSARTGRPTVLFTEGRRPGGTYFGCRLVWVSHTGQRVLLGCGFTPTGTHARQLRVLLAGPGHFLHVLPKLSSPASLKADITQGVLAER